MTDRYAVIGNPIEQSKSPLIHAEFARQTGQDLAYSRVLGPVGHFKATVDAFRAGGGRGMNVTTPFKLDAFAYATCKSAAAELAGAVNALKFEGDEVLCENFDGLGLVRDTVSNLACPLIGRRVLLLGAGGAARGALLPMLAEKPAALIIANRTLAKAQELAQIARSHADASTQVQATSYAELVNGAFDVVFNATSASFTGEAPPLPAGVFAPGALAYELAYGKGLTPFLKLAQVTGAARWVDGVGMLAEQAAEAFLWWRGVRPQTAGVIKLLTVPLV